MPCVKEFKYKRLQAMQYKRDRMGTNYSVTACNWSPIPKPTKEYYDWIYG